MMSCWRVGCWVHGFRYPQMEALGGISNVWRLRQQLDCCALLLCTPLLTGAHVTLLSPHVRMRARCMLASGMSARGLASEMEIWKCWRTKGNNDAKDSCTCINTLAQGRRRRPRRASPTAGPTAPPTPDPVAQHIPPLQRAVSRISSRSEFAFLYSLNEEFCIQVRVL